MKCDSIDTGSDNLNRLVSPNAIRKGQIRGCTARQHTESNIDVAFNVETAVHRDS